MALRPLKTYVRLNRQLGNTQKRIDDPTIYEMIVPIKLKNGTFAVPNNDRQPHFYINTLKKGKTVLLHSNKISWNVLCESDSIIELYQK
jgi:hypothetical protein